MVTRTIVTFLPSMQQLSCLQFIIVHFLHRCCGGPLAQSVERGADNAKVESSRLLWTNFLCAMNEAASYIF